MSDITLHNNNYYFSAFYAETLGDAWLKSMQHVLCNGQVVNDGEDRLLEALNMNITISTIDENDAVIIRYASKERIELMKRKHISCDIINNYKVSYGKLIYNNNGINQIEWLINRLRNNPDSKSATITLHIPGQEYLSCLSLLDYKIRDNRLNSTAIYRSQNIFASQPGNIIALRDLQISIAHSLEREIGDFKLTIISGHIYDPHSPYQITNPV